MELRDMLQILAKQDGSDLYLSTGAPLRQVQRRPAPPSPRSPWRPGEVARIAYDIMDLEQKQQFEKELEMNLAISLPQISKLALKKDSLLPHGNMKPLASLFALVLIGF